MVKIYPFKYQWFYPDIKPMQEDKWFEVHQPLLLRIANTREGRELLCIDQRFPAIDCFAKNFIRTTDKKGVHTTEFRIGSKWANVIRFRWIAFSFLAKKFYDSGDKTSILLDGEWKLAATTSTFYPDANPETSTVDGYAETTGSGSWTTVVNAAGNTINDTGVNLNIRWRTDTSSNTWDLNGRPIILFDTSSLGSDNINQAAISLWGNAKSDPNSDTPNINIYSSSPASNTSLTGTDYATLGSVEFSTSIEYDSFLTGRYNDFVFNPAGLDAIDGSGISKLGVRNPSYDVADSAPSWLADNRLTFIQSRSADQTGTSNDPKLTVVHGAISIVVNTHSLDLESGSSQYAWKDDPTGLDLTGDMTFECIVEPESMTDNDVIVMKGLFGETEAGNLNFSLLITAAGNLRFIHEYSTGTNESDTTASSYLTVGKKTRISMVRDDTALTYSFYINGNPVPVEVLTYTNSSTGGSTGDLYIGSDINAGNNTFDGKIDDIRIWDKKREGLEINFDAFRDLDGTESNLVGYWKLDNDYTDETSNSNDLTASGSPTFATDPGFVAVDPATMTGGNTVIFAGAEPTPIHNITVAHSADLVNMTSGTFALLFKPTTTLQSGSDRQGMVVRNYSTPHDDDYWIGHSLLTAAKDGLIEFACQDGPTVVRTTTASWSTTAFHWVIFSFDSAAGSNEGKAYVEGVLEATVAAFSAIGADTGSEPLYVGSNDGDVATTKFYFQGEVADVRIWKNRVLTPTEISNIVNGNYGIINEGLILHLNMEGNVLDQSDAGNDGSLVGASYSQNAVPPLRRRIEGY